MFQRTSQFRDTDISYMDETCAWNAMISTTTIGKTKSIEVNMKSTGHDKVHVSISLAGKADGTRLLTIYCIQRGLERKQIS